MSIIEKKLIEAYSVLVMANKYILDESDRENVEQILIPSKFKESVEIRVAEKIVERLS